MNLQDPFHRIVPPRGSSYKETNGLLWLIGVEIHEASGPPSPQNRGLSSEFACTDMHDSRVELCSAYIIGCLWHPD